MEEGQRREAYDRALKVVLVGNNSVGKTSILLRYTTNIFDESCPGTVGVDYKVQTRESNGVVLRLSLWDTCGQERYRSMNSFFYRDASGIVVVFDVTQRSSFESLGFWLGDTLSNVNSRDGIVWLLLACKTDLPERAVSAEEVQRLVDDWTASSRSSEFAAPRRLLFREVSAKTGAGVEEAFSAFLAELVASGDDAELRRTCSPQMQSPHAVQSQSPIALSPAPESVPLWRRCC